MTRSVLTSLSTIFNHASRSVRPKRLRTFIFFITSKCNQRCRGCFYRKNLNAGDDLTLDEVFNVFRNLPKFRTLLLSGGEPTLRTDLLEIIRFTVRHNRISSISFPTNGFIVEKSLHTLAELINIKEFKHINFAVSLDGIGSIHDGIRGCRGAFKNAWETLKKASDFAVEHSQRVSLSINTVIGSQSFDDLVALFDRVRAEMPYAKHTFEIIRGAHSIRQMKLNKIDLERFYRYVLQVDREDIPCFSKSFFEWIRLKRRYEIQKDVFFDLRAWPGFKCSAGRSVFVMDANGDVRLCEMKDVIGNVRDNYYNIPQLLKGKDVKAQIEAIGSGTCACTHVCFMYESMLDSPRFMFQDLPRHAFLLGLKSLLNVKSNPNKEIR